MDDKLKEDLKNLNIPDSKIEEIGKKKKFVERLKYVLDQAKVKKGDKELGLLLIQLAEKLNPTYNHRLPLLLKYVIPKDISSSQQLDAAIAYLRKKGEEEINKEEFEKQCGIGVKITDDDIRKEVNNLMKPKLDIIKKQRYNYPSLNLLYDLKNKFAFFDNKLAKKIIDEEINKVLGGKNDDEIKEEKLRKELEELKSKQKKEKKNFSEEDKKKLQQVKDELKKYDEAAKKLKEETKEEEEETESDKLSKLMARDMKSSLNPPELLKKHLEATGGKIITRFPPEPNGYLHLGHAKAMRFCFTSASKNGGHCYLRLDDTNPEKENEEFIESVKENVNWLGYKPWKVTFASDYLQQLYEIAVKLIKKGLAYVDDLSKEQMSEYREKKRDSPYRNRSVEENLKLFEKMRQGRFEEKECCLRMKIDMQHTNPCMRDPVAYRIKYVPHPHAGSDWCIYPTYDFTHCLNDSLENITHSLCTLEFEIRRDSYYWLLEAAEMYRPFVWEYSRLNVSHIVVSKRKLLQLVNSHAVTGWNDPRMPTIDGLRRRGYTPDAINNFVDRVGVTRRGNENIISISWLENSIRTDLDAKAPRTMAVIDPLKVTLKNLDKEVELDTFLFPKQKEKGGVRKVVLSKTIFIERTDFKEEEDKDFFGLTPKQEVGLKYAGIIKVEEVKKDKNGKVTELVCTYSSESKKTKGRIHWIGEKDYVQAEVRLYGYLFLSDDPFHANEEGASHDPMDDLNPNSLVTKMGALVHKDITKGIKHLDHFQFERVGYFVCDYDTQNEKGRYVFNLTVDLGDGKIDKMMEKESK